MVQCAALKEDGTKCKSHSKEGSKYCATHKGYRPKGRAKTVLENLKKARAMKKVRARAKDAPGGKGAIRNRPAAIAVMGAKSQCAATTQSGSQCKKLPRASSKYCEAHKGYRAKKA